MIILFLAITMKLIWYQIIKTGFVVRISFLLLVIPPFDSFFNIFICLFISASFVAPFGIRNPQLFLCSLLHFWVHGCFSVFLAHVFVYPPSAPFNYIFNLHHGVHQELPWMPGTLAATWRQGSGPYLRAVMKLPGWWHAWWSGPVPASTVIHTGKLSWAIIQVMHVIITALQYLQNCFTRWWKAGRSSCIKKILPTRGLQYSWRRWKGAALFTFQPCSLKKNM